MCPSQWLWGLLLAEWLWLFTPVFAECLGQFAVWLLFILILGFLLLYSSFFIFYLFFLLIITLQNTIINQEYFVSACVFL